MARTEPSARNLDHQPMCPMCNEPAIIGVHNYCVPVPNFLRLPCIVTAETAAKEPREGWPYPYEDPSK